MEKNAGQVRQIAISSIRVAERIRKENGSLDELAQDIQKHGLLNPITVMEQADGGYVLIAGLRRMKAVEQLNAVEIRATVMSPMEADEMLICCYKGRFIGMECKLPGGRLTELQKRAIHRINQAGGIACRVESVEDVRRVIAQADAERGEKRG